MRRTDILREHPEAGRIVPEYRDLRIREIIFRPYRIVYRFNLERKLVETVYGTALAVRRRSRSRLLISDVESTSDL